jgi:peptide/nickel transport system substrate-binding protein
VELHLQRREAQGRHPLLREEHHGNGSFLYDGNTKGQDWKGKKNPDYFGKDKDGTKLPYLDAYKALIITDANAGVTAIRSKQAMIEFRGFTPSQRDDLSRSLPNDLAIQEAPWICVNYVVPNTTKKPFDDPRVRRALTLAVDRWAGGEALSKTTIVKDVGGLMRPKGPFAMNDTDLVKIAGFGKDAAANKAAAKKLLADAGVPNLSFKFLNRNIQTPYEPVAVYLIDQWKQVGITATHDVKETSAYQADLRAGTFEVALDFNCDFLDEPDLQLAKFWSASKAGKGLNFAYYDDTKLDGFDRRAEPRDRSGQARQARWRHRALRDGRDGLSVPRALVVPHHSVPQHGARLEDRLEPLHESGPGHGLAREEVADQRTSGSRPRLAR